MSYDLEKIQKLLISDNADEQGKALKALTTMDDEPTFTFMLGAIGKVDDEIKRKLFNLIHNNKFANKMPVMVEHLLEGPPYLKHYQNYFNQPGLIKKYVELMQESTKIDDNVSETVIYLKFLIILGNESIGETISQMVSSDEQEIQLAALDALDKLNFPQLANTLLIAYKRDDDEIAQKVLEILKGKDMFKESTSLLHSIFDKSEEIQKITVDFFNEVDREEIKKYLGGALRKEEELKEKVLALFVELGAEELANDVDEASKEEEEKLRREEVLLLLSNVFLSRFNLSKILAQVYNIMEARDGAQAVNILKTKKVDMIITDKNLPNMTVSELVRNVRAFSPTIPITIFFSNLSDQEKEEVRQLGINHFIILPFHHDEVHQTIAQALETCKKSTKMDKFLKAYERGETIFREGERGECCYLIQAGRVRILSERTSGKPLILADLTTGDMFGEMSLITHLPRSASAVAADDTVLVVVGKDNFDAMIHQSPDFAKKLILVCIERIRRNGDQIKKLYDGFEDIYRMINGIVSSLGEV